MYINTLLPDYPCGFRWWHRYQVPPAAIVPWFVDKSSAWRPVQQRPRDGTVVRHKTGGLRRVS